MLRSKHGTRIKLCTYAPLFRKPEFRDIVWRKLDYEVPIRTLLGMDYIQVDKKILKELTSHAFTEINHKYRASHLSAWNHILKCPRASDNDKFVALELLKNANIAVAGVLPACQDTGTAIILGKRGERVITGGIDEEGISEGVEHAYRINNFRFSQVAPLSMFEEKNTRTNLPAQIDIQYGGDNCEYMFLFIAKGGGSANKSTLHQKTKALLSDQALMEFIRDNVKALGTAACPPYHLAIVIGGLSAELTMKTVKLASCKYYDDLPTTGSHLGTAFRDLEWEHKILEMSRDINIGAQFGGRYFLSDVRVIRLPRHGASCPVGIAVGCSADRQVLAKIDKNGVWIEKLVDDPWKYLPEAEIDLQPEAVKIYFDGDMTSTLRELTRHPVKTRLSLYGTLLVARDTAHHMLRERLRSGEPLPEYLKKYPIYYAGPAKTPKGLPSGSFGPTTAARMDPYMEELQRRGASLVTLGKGNRSKTSVSVCKRYGGFYLGSIGGAAASLTTNSIKNIKVIDMEDLGMEAIWQIEVENFPAFIVIDDKGNDFFES